MRCVTEITDKMPTSSVLHVKAIILENQSVFSVVGAFCWNSTEINVLVCVYGACLYICEEQKNTNRNTQIWMDE